MKYRKLGKSGLKVSEIGLGSWLTYGTATAADTAKDCIVKAYDLGINFFDSANAYNNGEAERVMGAALQAYPRSSYVLATKVFFPMGPGPNDRGLSRKHIMEQCEASLKRLGTDYIDLYQCHRYDANTLRALDDLTAQGKILYAGISEWSGAQITDAVRTGQRLNLRPLVSNQPIYNMFERYIEQEVIPVCEAEGLGQIVFSPLAQGVLTGKYKPGQAAPADSRAANDKTNGVINSYMREEVLVAAAKLEQLAAGLDAALSQLALAWILRQSNVSSAIIGASRPAQVEENAKAVDLELTAEILAEIEAIMAPLKSFAPAR
jgi:aryl-alcohol dehydrogenase-like predicted oxidoreductase